MKSKLQLVRALAEPVARSVRRGRATDLTSVFERLDALASAPDPDIAPFETGVIAGMLEALKGVLEFAMARAAADEQVTLLRGRKFAIPVLHTLAKQRRSAGNVAFGDSLSLVQLAKEVGGRSQNIGELVSALVGRQLLMEIRKSQERRLAITEHGIIALATVMPGWEARQTEKPEPDDYWTGRLESRIRMLESHISALRGHSAPETAPSVENSVQMSGIPGIHGLERGSIIRVEVPSPSEPLRAQSFGKSFLKNNDRMNPTAQPTVEMEDVI